MINAAVASLLILMVNPVEARMNQAEKKACVAYYDQQIERVNQRMRQSYREPTGNRLRSERSQYRDLKLRECR